MSNQGTLVKIGKKYIWSYDGIFTFEMHYDENGNYVGQLQDDIMGEGCLFLQPEIINNIPHVNGKPVKSLTNDEMRAANPD